MERKGLGSHRVLLIEHLSDYMQILQREGDNVFSSGVETHGETTYFRIVLKK